MARTSLSASRHQTRAQEGTTHITRRPCRDGIAGRARAPVPLACLLLQCSCRAFFRPPRRCSLAAFVLCPSLSFREAPRRLLFSRTYAAPFRCPPFVRSARRPWVHSYFLRPLHRFLPTPASRSVPHPTPATSNQVNSHKRSRVFYCPSRSTGSRVCTIYEP